MANTKFYNTPVPNENDDPWFDTFEEYAKEIDADIFGLLSSAGNLIIPPASVSFSFGTLSWVGSFQIPILGSGFFLNVTTGPDGLNPTVTMQNGDMLVVAVPVSSISSLTGRFAKVTGVVAAQQGLMICGMMQNGLFYHRFAPHL